MKRNRSFKLWCAEKRIPFLVFPIAVVVIIAIAMVCIGGTLVGWDIKGALTSKTAYLIYTLISLVAAYFIFTIITRKDKRE